VDAKKGKKGKKGRKPALLPGMAEAQTAASAALRIISLETSAAPHLAAAEVLRHVPPLLEGPVAAARCNARQVRLLDILHTGKHQQKPALRPV
jgi:hypothetical protein